jgi:Protein of unknown function (DUF3891)
MVLRRDERGVVAVGQPAHAWLCGQLAWAWGNLQLDPVVEVGLSVDGVLDPWPIATPVVSVHCDGRRLDGTFVDDAGLAAGLAQGPWETVRFELQHPEPVPPTI